MDYLDKIISKPKYIAVNSNKEIKVLDVEQISYLQSSNRYTIIHLKDGKTITVCKHLGHYEKLFENLAFTRIHNSFLVNIAYLSSIKKDSGGHYCVVNDDTIIPISNRKFNNLKKSLHY